MCQQKPGRELDERVAREVMEFRLHDFGDQRGKGWVGKGDNGCDTVHASCCLKTRVWGPNIHATDGLPKFSTSIEAAMELAERHVRGGCGYSVGGDGHTGWDAEMVTVYGRFEAHSDDSAAHAICLAELKAAEARVKYGGVKESR